MKHIQEFKDLLCKELDKIAERGSIDMNTLETAHKLTDTIKNIDKIESLENGGYSERRYSRDGRWEAYGSYGRGGYDDDSSYGRHYVRGHYSRGDGMSYNDGRMYSREDAKEHMMNRLGEMMTGATEKEREILKQCMQSLERA